MKFIIGYVIVLLFFSANEVLSDPSKNFCKNKRLEDGTQIPEGSCSLGIQGDIPSSAKMVSTLIVSPENGAVLLANAPFSVDVAIDNFETGFFSDPEKEYNIFPQSLTDQGVIQGHSHVTIQQIDNSNPPDSEKFEFFKGLNEQAHRGHLTVDVVREDGTPGLPAGRFRICTMSASFSHQPLVMPVAKRGAQDDCIRISVVVTPENEKGKEPNGKGKEPNGEGKEPNGEGKEPNGKGKEPNGEGKEPNGEGKEPNGEGKEPNGKGKEPNGEGKEPNGEGKEPNGKGKEPNGKGKEKEEKCTNGKCRNKRRRK